MGTIKLTRSEIRRQKMYFLNHHSLGSYDFVWRSKKHAIIAVILLLLFAPLSVEGANDESNITLADSLFKEGQFTEAEAIYAEIVKKEPDNYQAVLSLGRINLYENSLEESEKWLKKAMKLNPEDKEPKTLLAEAYYRRDDFQQAAPLFRGIDKIAMADKLQYLSDKVPYQIESDADVTSVEFVQTDPLPIVKMRINGSKEALFLIDTGGWELGIDSELAEEVGAKKFGKRMATYAGGKQAAIYDGVVDQVEIGDFKIKNVPVNISDSPKMAAAMLGVPIRGVIGTVFLYHCIFTFDYPNGKLILQRKTKENVTRMKALVRSKDKIVVPFWMAGDHFMVARGTVNKSGPILFFVDTGMAGGGFTGSDRTVKEANIQLPEESLEGVGGGGKVMVKAAVVDELTLGDAKETNVMGIFGAFDNTGLEYLFGFRIGGIISHGFLRPYKLTFDFTTMNLILERERN
jgi:predicted aspartyl protease